MEYINALPDELLIQIFTNVPKFEIHNTINSISRVCLRWRELSKDPSLNRCLYVIWPENAQWLQYENAKPSWSINTLDLEDLQGHVKEINLSDYRKQYGRLPIIDLVTSLSFFHFEKLSTLKLTEEAITGLTDLRWWHNYLGTRHKKLVAFSIVIYNCANMFDYAGFISSFELKDLEIIHHFTPYCCNTSPEYAEYWDLCFDKLTSDNLKNLRILKLEIGFLYDSCITKITNFCRQIEIMDINCNAITSNCFENTKNQNLHLREIKLAGFLVQDETLFSLSIYSPNMKKLSIKDSHLSDVSVEILVRRCRFLEKLSIEANNNDKLSNFALCVLSQSCRHLTELSLSSATSITDTAIFALADECSDLLSFKITNNDLVTDSSLLALSDKCKRLGKLWFTKCNNITGFGISYILRNSKQLRRIRFDYCNKINNLQLFPERLSQKPWEKANIFKEKYDLLYHHSHVRYVSFYYCGQIDYEAVIQIASFCPDILEMELIHCPRLSEQLIDIELIKHMCPNIIVSRF